MKALEAELKKGVDVNLRTRDSYKDTPLMLAVAQGKPRATKVLLASKASAI